MAKLLRELEADQKAELERIPRCACQKAVGVEQDFGDELSILRCTTCNGLVLWTRLQDGTAIAREGVLQ